MLWLAGLWVCLTGLMGGSVLAAEARTEQTASDQPIPVVRIDRKEPVDFAREVEPILAKRCLACHSGSVKEGLLDLGTHEGLLKGGKRGAAVVPGNSADSLLVKLSGKTLKPFMPPKREQPLTPEELAILKLWIDQGAKPSAGPKLKPPVRLTALPATVRPIRALALRADNSLLAVGRGAEIHLYEPTTAEYRRALIDPELIGSEGKPIAAAHRSVVEALAFSPDGKLLASSGFQAVTLWDPQTGAPSRRLTGFAERVVALAFSPDGKLLATTGGAPTEEGEIKIFETDTGKLLTDIKGGHSDTVFGVCFSPDGKLLATSGADRFVKVFEVASGKFVKSFEGHTHHVLDVGWRADGKLLASAGADNVVKVWDYEKGEQTRTISGHTRQITRLAFVGTTAQIVTCGGDQLVRFWNVENGSGGVRISGGNDFLYALAVSPDARLVVAGGEEGVVRIFNGTNGQLVKQLPPPQTASPTTQK